MFDVLFGVAMPALCLWLDPVVFQSQGLVLRAGIRPALPEWRAVAWVLLPLEMATILAYVLARPERPRWNALAAGALWVGAAAAFALAALLLPLAIPASFFAGIGLLGLVPWFTGIAFLRNAVRATRRGRAAALSGLALAVLAAAALVAPPAAADHASRTAMRDALAGLRAGGPTAVADATASLARWRWLVTDDDLVHEFHRLEDPRARERFAATYRNLTGRSIAEREQALYASFD